MTQFFSCDSPTYSNGAVLCSSWVAVTPEELHTQITQPDPENLLLAFGTGLAVMLPLYAVLWGVRRARDALKQS